MAVPFSNTKLRVPAGFQALLEGVAKEVLMMQPPDIYTFCAMYFEGKLSMRDGDVDGDHDPSAKCAEIEDRTYNNLAFQNADDASNVARTQAATTIQGKYRQFQAKATVDELRQEKAAIKIQSCGRGFLDRQRVKKMREERYTARTVDVDSSEDRFEAFVADGDQQTPLESSRSGAEPDESNPTEETHEDELELESDRSGSAARSPVAQSASQGASPTPRAVSTSPRISSPASSHPSAHSPLPEVHEDETGDTERSGKSPVIEEDTLESGRNLKDDSRAHSRNEDSGAEHIEDEAAETEEERKSDGGLGLTDDATPREMENAEEKDMETDGRVMPQSPHGDNELSEVVETAQEGEEQEEEKPDEELEKAVTKIQAGFRGMKARQEMKEKKNERGESETAPEEKQNAELPKMLTEENSEENGVEPEIDPEVEKAAMRIQAGFRGMKARKEMKDARAVDAEDANGDIQTEAKGEETEMEEVDDAKREMAASKIQAGFRGMKTRQELREAKAADAVNDAENVQDTEQKDDADTGRASATEDDSKNREQAAAVKIQAGFRGYQTRKGIKLMAVNEEGHETLESKDDALADQSRGASPKNEGELNPDELPDENDPAVQEAATMIQARFRGHMARKQKDERPRSATLAAEPIQPTEEKSSDDDDPVRNAAAARIQAGFKGHKMRKELKSKEEQQNAVDKIQAGFKSYKVRQDLKTPDNDEKATGNDENEDGNETS